MKRSSRGSTRTSADTTHHAGSAVSACFRTNPRLLFAVLAFAACGGDAGDDAAVARESPSPVASASIEPQDVAEEEPTQWTAKEVARRLTDGGLIVTDSGRTTVRHPFIAVEGARLRVSESELQIFVYPDAASRQADSEHLDAGRASPSGTTVDWPAKPHLVTSGNLLAIHLTPNERLAERVRLILEAWHSSE